MRYPYENMDMNATFLIHSDAWQLLSHSFILFYFTATEYVKQVEMCKSLFPVFGSSKMENFIPNGISHFSQTNWFLYEVKWMCSQFGVRARAHDKADIGIWLHESSSTSRQTNKQTKIVCWQLFGRKTFIIPTFPKKSEKEKGKKRVMHN